MNRPSITPKRLLIAIAFLLLIISQLPAGAATTVSVIPRSIVAFLVSPPSVMLRRLSNTLRPPRKDQPDFADSDLAEQLAQQKVYADNLEQEVLLLRREIQSLVQTKRFVDLGDISLVPASVTMFNGSLTNPIITLDRGEKDGLREGLAVVWGSALVGEVTEVWAHNADVRLITAAGTKLQVRIAKPTADGATAPLPAVIELSDDGRSFFTDAFALDAPVEKGDLVHLADDRWQFRARGFIVGQVVSADKHEDRPLLLKHVVVRPMLPLTSLTRATVLVPVD